jgi:hypothetical protein
MSLVVDGDEVTSISPRQRRGFNYGTEQQRANQYGISISPRTKSEASSDDGHYKNMTLWRFQLHPTESEETSYKS